ncbi:MAG: DUF4249 domain-containing protein [Bacteroidota bacterium]
MRTLRFFPLLAATVLFGCDEFRTQVELDVPDIDDQLVVNSFYTPDSLWSVLVTGHRYILNDDPIPYIDGATVSLYSGSELLAEVNAGDSGYYELPITPQIETDYTLRVSHPNYPTAEVQTRLSTPIPLESLTIDSLNDISFEGFIPGVLSLRDPGGETNYYQLILYSDIRYPLGIEPDGDTLWEEYSYPIFFQLGGTSASAGEIIEVNADVFGFLPGQVFSDEIFDGQLVDLTFEVYNEASYLPPGTEWSIFAEFRSLSADYYDYAFSLGVQRNALGNPFAQPAQVFTNVQDGLGIVAGYGRTTQDYQILR